MNCKLVLCLLVFAKTALTDSYDPSGWNSYFVMNSHDHTDGVDVVDPSGWNYDRESKSSISDQEDKEQVIKFDENNLEKENLPKYIISNEIEVADKSKIEALVNEVETRKENDAFAKRFISILLQSADLFQKTVDDEQDVSGFIEIRVSAEHLKTLIHFTNSIVNVSMRELDSILTASIHSSHNPVSGFPELIDKIFFMTGQKELWLPIFLFFIMIGLFKLIKTRQTTTQFVITVILLIFTAGYLVEYHRMYKEIEIRQRITLEKHGGMPSSCSTKDRSLWTAIENSFVSYFSMKNDDCEQYYKAALLDPLLEVSPVRVLSSILSDFILHPFEKIGTAIAAFTSAVIGGLPVHYGWIVYIGSSIAFFLLIVLAVMILIGGAVRFHCLFGGVSVTRNQTPIAQPPPAEPAVTAPVAPSLPLANAVLEGVSEMRNFVLMDANSLGTLILRAQSNVILHPSGVQELTDSSKNQLPLRPSMDKIDLSKVQLERSLSSTENISPSSGECSNVEKGKKTVSENIDINLQEKSNSKSTNSPIVQEELLVSFEVIQSTEIHSGSSEADGLKVEGRNSLMERKE